MIKIEVQTNDEGSESLETPEPLMGQVEEHGFQDSELGDPCGEQPDLDMQEPENPLEASTEGSGEFSELKQMLVQQRNCAGEWGELVSSGLQRGQGRGSWGKAEVSFREVVCHRGLNSCDRTKQGLRSRSPAPGFKSIPGQGERALQPKTRSDEDLWGWQRSSLRPLPRQAKKVTHWWQGENFRLLICLSLVIPVSH